MANRLSDLRADTQNVQLRGRISYSDAPIAAHMVVLYPRHSTIPGDGMATPLRVRPLAPTRRGHESAAAP